MNMQEAAHIRTGYDCLLSRAFSTMAPIAVEALSPLKDQHETASPKTRMNIKHEEHDVHSFRPPVADDFMYDFKYNHPLPTTNDVAIAIPQDCDAQKEANGIVARLAETLDNADAEAFTEMFLEHGRLLTTRITWLPAGWLIASHRCLAGQASVHLGLPYLQLPHSDPESCQRSPSSRERKNE